ncbi:AMP-binding protein, partial [Nocardia nova]
ARRLIRHGIGTGDRVALGLTRSVDSVVTVLAIAKTGAAFVPVDPNYPADRVRHMLADSGCAVGVTVSAHRERLRAADDRGIAWIVLDDTADAEFEPAADGAIS